MNTQSGLIVSCVVVFSILALISCGGGGGSGTNATSESDQPDTSTTDPIDVDGGSESTGEEYADSMPTPPVIPIPLSDSDPPILSGNIFSMAEKNTDLKPPDSEFNFDPLFLLDDSKQFQTDDCILFYINWDGYSVSPDGSYIVYRTDKLEDKIRKMELAIKGINGNFVYKFSDSFEDLPSIVWLPDNSSWVWLKEDTKTISRFNISTKKESTIYENSDDYIESIDSLAISPDGKNIAWIERSVAAFNYLLCAELQNGELIGEPRVIWEGASLYTFADTRFIANKQLVFFLRQLDKQGTGSYINFATLVDIESGNAENIYTFSKFDSYYNILVSNNGKYIVFILNRNNNESIHIIDVKTGASELIGGYSPRGKISLDWSPDDRYLLFQHDSSIYLYPFPELDKKWLINSFSGQGLYNFIWTE